MTAITLQQITLERMRSGAGGEDACVVGFSGGKDSLAALSLARQVFKRVIPVYYYLAPGMAFVEKRLAVAKDHFGLEVARFPSGSLVSAIRNGHYRPRYVPAEDWPDLTMDEQLELTAMQFGVKAIVTGRRGNDFNKRNIALKDGSLGGLNPLASWTKWDVLAYLKRQSLPVPDSFRDAGGEILTAESMLWIHDNHPDDFKRLEKVFPFAGAIVWRDRWYGPLRMPG